MAKKVQFGVDRISALPDDPLCHIITFLPTKDAVSTSILSTRWRYLFASMSNLDFEYNYDSKGTPEAFMNFVDRVLFLRERPNIDRFRLKCDRWINQLRVEGWIHGLLWRSIRELDLSMSDLDLPNELPAGLFICKTLVVLRLSGICLQVPPSVYLPSLKVLDLQYCTFKDDDFGELLSFGCPVLEDLVLAGEVLGEKCKLNISNASLKRLTIGIQSSEESDYHPVEITVNVQNLVYLKYYNGTEDNSLSCINVPSLIEACIDFWQPYNACPDYRTSATHLMKGIKNIQLLNISVGTLLDLNLESVPLPLFRNLTCLRTSIDKRQSFLGLVRLLQHSSFLETLIMEKMPTMFDAGDWLEQEHLRAPGADLPWLKAIEILKFEGDESHMEIVEYFLENAKVLENLTICISGEEKKQLEITKELLMFPRVSMKCRVRIV